MQYHFASVEICIKTHKYAVDSRRAPSSPLRLLTRTQQDYEARLLVANLVARICLLCYKVYFQINEEPQSAFTNFIEDTREKLEKVYPSFPPVAKHTININSFLSLE